MSTRIDSDFAILDVKRGRGKLAARLERGETVRVRVEMTLLPGSGIGRDDGESIEFSSVVTSAQEIEP